VITYGKWEKRGKTVTGVYAYSRSASRYSVRLDVKCRYTGQPITAHAGDGWFPEFNGWKLTHHKDRPDEEWKPAILPQVPTTGRYPG
jgi:hypothetical protein